MKPLVVILIALSAFIVSCSPEKKLARLIRKHPELVKSDTVFKRDTTVVNGVQHDTVFHSTITRDTVIIRDKQLTIKYYNDGKTTYLKGVCDTVRVIKEVPVLVNSVNPVDVSREGSWYDRWVFRPLAFILIILLSVEYLLRKFFKRS